MICLPREIDNWLTEGSFRNVRFLRQSLALIMAVFWLFATQHCGLESAGLLGVSCEQTAGMHDCGGADHSTDGCQVVESGTYKLANSLVKVSAPQLTECACLICLQCVAPMLAPAVEVAAEDYAERPQDWIPVWSFEQRTALSPRAPSLS
jgi:hypothetical protein